MTGGDRVGVQPITIEPGTISETVTVTAESPLVQTQSAERSYAVSATQIDNLPVARNNFTSMAAFTPGVVQTGDSAGATRQGGAGQNNIMMDGISAMDTGNNGQMLNMNVDAIGEVKILTQGYQAEYGRSSGLQITAVTKSGTNKFRGSAYDIQTNSDWDANSWVNEKNGDPKVKQSTKTLGYTLGGPVGQAGRQQQAVLLLLARVSPGDRADQRRQPDPHPRADRARARRRLLADARQHRRDLQPDQGSELVVALHRGQHGRLLPGRRRPRQDSGGPAVFDGHRPAEPLPAAQRHAGRRAELQL